MNRLRQPRTLAAGVALSALVAALSVTFVARGQSPSEILGGFDFAGGEATAGNTTLIFSGTDLGAAIDETTGTGIGSGEIAVAVAGFCDDLDGLTAAREARAQLNPCLLDSDGDGLRDGGDVEFVQSGIAALPKSSFGDKGKGGGHQSSMQGILDEVETALLAGDTATARQKITNLRKRVDGCGSRPDKDDQVIVCADQLLVRDDLDLLLSNLPP